MKKHAFFIFIIFFVFNSNTRAQNKTKSKNMPKKLSFGIYAPNTAFSSNSQRWSYIKNLSRYVSSTLKIPCSGRAYSSVGSFAGAMSKLDFAIVDPVYVSTHRSSFKVLATSRYGGGSRTAWSLFSRLGSSFKALKGKTLVMARAGGSESSFATGLLHGEINASKYFGKIKIVPDLASAVQTVRNGAGDAVFAPNKMASGLTRVFSAGTVPNASFVQINRNLPASVVKAARNAVRSVGSSGLGSMGGAAAGGIKFGKTKATFLSSYPGVLRFKFNNFLKPIKSTYEKASLRPNFWK
ncbi:MAG: hypothetical protein ACQES9_04810 [Myxococcota bacterium]